VLKNLSLTALISLVSFTSVLIGILLGYTLKQPVTDLTETFFEEKISKPFMHIIEFKELTYSSAEPFFTFGLFSQIVTEIDNEPAKENYAQELITGYLKFQLPKVKEYCESLYPKSKVFNECFDKIEASKTIINKHQSHHQQLHRAP
jgi:hypothetical protein